MLEDRLTGAKLPCVCDLSGDGDLRLTPGRPTVGEAVPVAANPCGKA